MRSYPLKDDHLSWWDHRCATCGNWEPAPDRKTGGCWGKGVNIDKKTGEITPKKTFEAAHGSKCIKWVGKELQVA